MTDKETLLDMFERNNIEFDDTKHGLYIEAYTNNVNGYTGFYTAFNFNNSGQLRSIDIKE